MIGQQARFHKISDAFVCMQRSDGYDFTLPMVPMATSPAAHRARPSLCEA